jgi:hypothetical protein
LRAAAMITGNSMPASTCIYGHRFKCQTGLQYASMDDRADIDDRADDGGEHEGWGLTSGLRIYW